MEQITMRQLHRIAGYVEAGEGVTVSFGQDDATRSWSVRVGGMRFYGESLGEAFQKALDQSNTYHKETYDMGPA